MFLSQFLQLRKNYVIRCIEDIKRSPAVYLPLKQLHFLCQSLTTNKNSYYKNEKVRFQK